MLLVLGKIGKACKVGNFFCLEDRRNSRHFFQTWSLARGQNSRMLITLFRSERNAQGKLCAEELGSTSKNILRRTTFGSRAGKR